MEINLSEILLTDKVSSVFLKNPVDDDVKWHNTMARLTFPRINNIWS